MARTKKTPCELAYAAGLFDGEGSLCIRRDRRSGGYILTVTLTNTVEGACLLFKDLFGGNYIKRKGDERRQDLYVWKQTHKAAREFLQEILPYILLKREQVLLAFEFCQLAFIGKGRRHRKTPEWAAMCESLKLRMHDLNVRRNNGKESTPNPL